MTDIENRAYDLAAINHRSDYFRDDVYGIYEQLREIGPVVHTTEYGGFYFLLDYDAVFDADQDTETFSSRPSRNIPVPEVEFPFIPLDVDPPMHARYRKIGLPWFSPNAAKRSEAQLRRVTTELIDAFIERGEADIVGELTTPLPAIWILQLLGFDESRWPDFVEWIHAMIHQRATPHADECMQNLVMSVVEQIEQRRTAGFGDDLLSAIMQARVDDELLPDHLVLSYTMLMLIGGMDTTSGLTGNSIVQLIHHPHLRQRLIDEPDVLSSATEEFLRHSTPSQTQGRVVTKECVFKGQKLSEGDTVMLVHAAANRDPKAFPDPERIDFDRSPNRHIAFGVGPHRCLGANHARVMFKVMISEILERLPDFELNGEVEYFPEAGDVYAVSRLPIRFTPGERRGTGGGGYR